MTRYELVDEQDRPVMAFGDRGVFPRVTYASMTEAVLALIFVYGDRPGLRAVPVTEPMLPFSRLRDVS